jgi:cytochrome c biogenesis protein CcmG/thiol:disulfide interchange protein DsbE
MVDQAPIQSPPVEDARRAVEDARRAERYGRLQLLLAALLVAVAGVIVAGITRTQTPQTARLPVGPLTLPVAERKPAPAFSLRSLRGEERVSLAAFAGRVTVINFFASWCNPCELEAADLERAWQANRARGVAFVGIAIQDRPSDAAAFVERHGVSYPTVIDDDNATMRAYRISGIPTTVFVDSAGRVASVHAGVFVGDEGVARLQARIDAVRTGAENR